MKYTKYFSGVLKNEGIPNLDSTQYRRLMNIVHVEGAIKGLNICKERQPNPESYHKYDMQTFHYNRKLTELTGNVEPGLLLREMLKFSEDELHY